jgi:hypothetical protein
MGKLRALSLGIIKGQPSWTPVCPNRHDVESLTRLAQGNWGAKLLNRGVSGSIDLIIAKAVNIHAEKCNPSNPKEYCDCDYCRKVQERRHADD